MYTLRVSVSLMLEVTRVFATFLMFEAATAKVDHLDRTLGWVLEQYVLGLQVTMHDPVVSHQSQRSEHLRREAADKIGGKPLKSICLDELVEVDAQQLHGDAEVTPEVEMFRHFDDMVLLIRILASKGK